MTGPDHSTSPPREERDASVRVPPPYPARFGEAPGAQAAPAIPDRPDPDRPDPDRPVPDRVDEDAEPTADLDRPIWDQEPAAGHATDHHTGPLQDGRPPVPAAPVDYGYYGGFGRHAAPPMPPVPPPPQGRPLVTGWPGPRAWPAGVPGPAPATGRRSGVPGWVWPVVAVVALVTGLVGGAVGGLLVSPDRQPAASSTEPIPLPRSSPGPLPAGNASIAAVADKVLPSTVQVLARGGAGTVGGGTGSGFVVDRRGHVITNNHVVERATEAGDLVVVDHTGRRYPATIVGRSPVYDIAVLAVERGRRLPAVASGAAARLRIGDTVVAIGSPLGLSSTVTSGIVSAVNRPVTTGDAEESSYINAVQTDAAINPGNSGGPLVNLRGEVVGVNSAIATTGGLAGEAGSIGVGFAIPMEQVRVTANQILASGKAEYPVIGANVDTQRVGSGAKVVDVPNGTPAAAAGLEEGDVVVAVEGQRVADGIGLIVAIRSHRPGETITLTVRRDGRQRDVTVRLDSKVG